MDHDVDLGGGADDGLVTRLAEVDARIADAAASAGRDVRDLTRIVVTKFQPVSVITRLRAAGVRDVGENRQQELARKIDEIGAGAGLAWHYIGQLQTNKARALRAAASVVPLVVHSVDRARLARALDAAAPPDAPRLDVLVQINLTDDPDRGGVAPAALRALVDDVQECATLRLRGVMAVAPLDGHPARAFERLARCSAEVRAAVPDAGWISAGMTADFAEAVAAGATHLRIGSAITGPRPARG